MKASKIFITIGLIRFLFFASNNIYAQAANVQNIDHQELRLAALDVLQSKCNTCHRFRNPSKVFTLENMDAFSKSINKQVFVFKRMPKGKKRRKKMSEEDFQTLKTWIESKSVL